MELGVASKGLLGNDQNRAILQGFWKVVQQKQCLGKESAKLPLAFCSEQPTCPGQDIVSELISNLKPGVQMKRTPGGETNHQW